MGLIMKGIYHPKGFSCLVQGSCREVAVEESDEGGVNGPNQNVESSHFGTPNNGGGWILGCATLHFGVEFLACMFFRRSKAA